jgi:hypothetical protein
MARIVILLISLLWGAPLYALDLSFEGYGDMRLVAHSSQTSATGGGLGKLRFGASDGALQFTDIVGQGRLQLTPELGATLVARIEPDRHGLVDVIEAYARYRPLSQSAWRWSLKLGAFFPPISLENREIGWTSYWTLTPSAINSWVGEELRTIGTEARVEWRRPQGSVTLTGAIFGLNDPGGVMMADHGWALQGRASGLFHRLRQPDAIAILSGDPPPVTTPLFKEIDNRLGWYAALSWAETGLGTANILYYDNNADSSKDVDEIYAWRTKFWNIGLKTSWKSITLMAQGMTGSTAITPAPNFTVTTDFDAAYILAGWEVKKWRLAARADIFKTWRHTSAGSSRKGESGHAATFSASWLPLDWLRVTAEIIHIDSTRPGRTIIGLDPGQRETQGQFSARIYY